MNFKPKNRDEFSLDITPLIDVVFLLLIFFMVSTTFKDESEIKEFCSTKYGVTFPMFATSSVKGKKANNFYKDLIRKTGVEPGWNFHKYLIDKDGSVSSFNTKVEPNNPELIDSIRALL